MENKEFVTARKLGLYLSCDESYVRRFLRLPNAPKPKVLGVRALKGRSPHLYDEDECLSFLKLVMKKQ
jgi:hypothetical protein